MKRLMLVSLYGLIFCGIAVAADLLHPHELPQWMKQTTGTISNIDLSRRTVNVNAVRYHLPSATSAEPLTVMMLGKDYGSIELLQNGMAVNVYYRKQGNSRLALILIQVEKAPAT